jgi:hypothetical protein
MEARGCIIIGLAIFKKLTWAGIKHPLTNFWGVRFGLGNPLGIFEPNRNMLPAPPNFEKKYCPCILEGCLATYPMLNALHLQGLKSNIYVHFQLVITHIETILIQNWFFEFTNLS